MIALIKRYAVKFTWKSEDMVGIPRSLIEHPLNINPNHSLIKQKKCIMTREWNTIINKEVKDLVATRVMRATQFPKWITNLVLVMKGDDTM